MPDFTIGTVCLNVRQLQPMLDWYQSRLGLHVHWQEGNRAALGAGEHDLLVLTETPDYTRSRQHTGLFHFAILVPDRVQLAKSLTHLANTQTQLQGMSDHAVSEALYLADPEGNGIEIYRDRPKSDWYDKDGNFLLTTMRLDVADLLAELETAETTWQGLPADTIMGHIHLHVTDIPRAETVYTTQLGMETMLNMGSASFIAYDGYHHHVGANIWGGRIHPPSDAHLGLTAYDLHLPTEQRETVLATLESAGVTITPQADAYQIRDVASHTLVNLRTE